MSLTGFVVRSVAQAAAAFPEVHAYRTWRGQLVHHRHVDVQTLVEVPMAQGPFGLVHVVRDADVRDVADVSRELRAVKADATTTGSGRMLERFAPVAGRVPGLFRAMYAVMGRSVRGLSRRPRVVDEQITIRDVLDLTVTVDHNVVDGAPATRFGAHLRSVLENAAVLT
jgi:pyruvate/2-oxoglutarate dehydrogenase complex dihydrolipoamide acyltransferase (E2) component